MIQIDIMRALYQMSYLDEEGNKRIIFGNKEDLYNLQSMLEKIKALEITRLTTQLEELNQT